jgi:hypothetical protein
MPSLSHKRGTRAQVDAAAAANALRAGEVYLITDEARLTVGTSASTHQPAAKQGEGGGDPWTWIKLAADVANNTITPVAATGLSFAAAANTMYLVEIIGTFQSAAATTGIALALDIPSGSVAGMTVHQSNATALTGAEQIADGTPTGATTGVRAAATNIPIRANFVVSVGATAGQVQLLFRSEIAGSAVTLKAGLTAMGRRII